MAKDQKSGLHIALKVYTNLEDPDSGSIEEFSVKFMNGYNNRASVRFSKPSKVKPDRIIDIIIHSRLPDLTLEQVELISEGHRVAMTAENILGYMLEEYIHENVIPFGWTCCWGSVLRSIDFVSKKGELLQVKNRSNSENSSSSRVRLGTEIRKWHRIDANSGVSYWEKLNKIIGKGSSMSEEKFSEFVKALVQKNPDCIYIDPSSEIFHR
jgi:hypothetical protein